MHKDRMYTLTGIFVVGTLILLITSTVFLYDAWRRARMDSYVMFFKGSLQGLEATAPVTYRGIKIGEVTHIEVTENQADNTVKIPVYVQFSVDKSFGYHGNPIQQLIENGMVANITTPNLLTGRSSIEIVPSPVTRKYQPSFFHKYPLFPTYNKTEKFITIDQVLDEAKKTLESIQVLVKSKDITDTLTAIRTMAEHVDALTKVLNEKTPPAFTAMDQSMIILNQTMKQFMNTSISIQNLTDYLSRYPESLLRGKK